MRKVVSSVRNYGFNTREKVRTIGFSSFHYKKKSRFLFIYFQLFTIEFPYGISQKRMLSDPVNFFFVLNRTIRFSICVQRLQIQDRNCIQSPGDSCSNRFFPTLEVTQLCIKSQDVFVTIFRSIRIKEEDFFIVLPLFFYFSRSYK